jgi:hypothetical protein
MKNFKFLLATAFVFAVGSAFTSAKTEAEDLWVRNGDGTYQLKSPDGECIGDQGTCSYHKIDPQGPNDASNFTAAEAGNYVP